MKIVTKSEVISPSDSEIMEFAKHVAKLCGSQSLEKFLRGEEITYTVTDFGKMSHTTYQLSEPAKGLLRDKTKKDSSLPEV